MFVTKRVNIPVQIGNRSFYVAVHIFDGSLPHLISLRSLILMGAVIDMKHSSVSIGDPSEKFRLKISSLGHLSNNLESCGDNPINPNVWFKKNGEISENFESAQIVCTLSHVQIKVIDITSGSQSSWKKFRKSH